MLTGILFYFYLFLFVIYNRVAKSQVIEVLKVAVEVVKIDIDLLFKE